MRYVFIINPVAGKGKGKELLEPRIKEYFKDKDIDYKIYITKKRGDAGNFAFEEAKTGDEITLFSCGGEGTSFEIINRIADFDNITLGVLPCGSANDFIKAFGEKEHFLDISKQIDGKSIKVDLIKADEFYCINGCSAGMDAVVADDMSIFKKWPGVSGPLAYKLAIVKNFVSKIGVRIKISIDGKLIGVRNSLFAVIANGPVYGGGFISAPKAITYDGKLNYTLVDVISKFEAPKFLKLYNKGMHEGLSYCALGNCESMEIETLNNKPIPINLDGEIIHRSKISFKIIKSKLNFLIPSSLIEKIGKN